jgi:SAM-dependent methyltransferase
MLSRTALVTQLGTLPYLSLGRRSMFFSSQLRKLSTPTVYLQPPINVNLNRAFHSPWRAFSGGGIIMADALEKKEQVEEKKLAEVDASRMEASAIREAVRGTYGKYAQESQATGFFPSGGGCSCSSKKKPASGSCCGVIGNSKEYAAQIGYTAEDVELAAASGANLGLGCGNPTAIATLQAGEVVLDLGSGAGFDCFLAAKKVGPEGRVIGVDMTPDMIELARKNAAKHGYTNVTFELGQIEALPLPDNSVDVVISNCVINLSPDKQRVLTEAARVLKPGGRFVVSDVIATREIPEHIRKDLALYTGCMAGATPVARLEKMMQDAGFGSVRIEPKADSRSYIGRWAPESHAEDYVASATIFAYKPTPKPVIKF